MVSGKTFRGIVLKVCQLFTLESTLPLFTGHEVDVRQVVVEDDCSTQLTKRVTDIDFTLCLFNYDHELWQNKKHKRNREQKHTK